MVLSETAGVYSIKASSLNGSPSFEFSYKENANGTFSVMPLGDPTVRGSLRISSSEIVAHGSVWDQGEYLPPRWINFEVAIQLQGGFPVNYSFFRHFDRVVCRLL